MLTSVTTSTPDQWAVLQNNLADIAGRHPGVVFASSLGVEDMLLAHAIFDAGLPIEVFTLDTGRLHAETLALVERIHERYGVTVNMVRPDPVVVKRHVDEHGAFAFYESIELRKACCGLRKVEPLRRILRGRPAWITGQRREQSLTRTELAEAEFDEVFGLQKYNPLAGWSLEQVWESVRARDIPYNPLHDQGYPSIGCEPCTRAIRPDEDVRAGRWWWEQKLSRECGLHAKN
ncbi:phosphoadenylyl-sulfate reductase [Pollutimonas harenae]|uniref:Adenosine 5'-phosphosulfate reductase n=1 Tax=Pollutimonas harenae TaxID=657015 RepID=A0A853H0W4_9BURK|nr:phosphoadenylyl-sulfate reductase [Pollutimonas harenae]NYT84895.1 phosphoadenylyl-sulfate reductase [Pollutimonas harenae]TEA73633.1 phosphoadenylyl-sulfate reductase [Pollutimonas harenae]